MSVLHFVFDTLQPRINNQSNSHFWMPGVLEGISGSNPNGKMLPLVNKSFNVGELSDQAGKNLTNDVINQLAQLIEHGWYNPTHTLPAKYQNLGEQVVIANPETPYPSLSFSNMNVDGLSNVFLEATPTIISSDNGYTMSATLKMNTYSPTPKQLSIKGDYKIEQDFGSAYNSSPTTVNGNYVLDLTGTGTISATISDVEIEVTAAITINGTGANRSVAVDIQTVEVKASKPVPPSPISLTDITIKTEWEGLKSTWKQTASEAIQSGSAWTGFKAALNEHLNSSDNRSKLSDTLTSKLTSQLNSVFGTVPSGLPNDSGQGVTNPVDQYLFDRVRVALNNQSSDWYLPSLILGVDNPKLEPFTDASITIPPQNVGGLNWNITLTDVSVAGLSNIAAPASSIVFTDTDVTIDAEFGTLNPPPSVSGGTIPAPPMTLSANFNATLQGDDTPVTGTITINVSSSSASLTATASGDKASELAITISAMSISASSSNMDVKLHIDGSGGLGPIVKGLLDTDSVKKAIVQQLNSAITAKLPSINSSLSSAIQSKVANALGPA